MPLFCCHVRGPDDVIPTPDYLTALRLANLVNADIEAFYRDREWTDNDPLTWASPVPWVWDAATHAAGVADPSPDYAAALAKARGEQ